MTDWQPIENAPDHGLLLLYYPPIRKARDVKGFALSATIMIGVRNETPNRQATHWQPLPPPPEDSKK